MRISQTVSWRAGLYAYACTCSVSAVPAQLGLRLSGQQKARLGSNDTLLKVPAPPLHEKMDSKILGSPDSLLGWESKQGLDDSALSAPALLEHVVNDETAEVAHELEIVGSGTHLSMLHRTVPENVKANMGSWIIGIVCLAFGLLVLWFNEHRSVKTDTLLSRGLSECESIDAFKPSYDSLGCLVHVQGTTEGLSQVIDPQFQGATVNGCLKFQSTIEVYEWVQTVKISQSGRLVDVPGRKNNIQYDFHREWSTIHRNSHAFQSSAGKASPENPRPPRGLNLGTATTVCKNVQLGNFKLPEDMVDQLRNFQPAMPYLPKTVEACGLKFHADKDGYYYARPSARSTRDVPWRAEDAPSKKAVVGDIRARFLCVLPGDATVAAVHCRQNDIDTFVRFRAIPRGCCSSEDEDRIRLIEEGQRSRQEIKQSYSDMAPCITKNRVIATCFCCPCSTINSVCSKEVVTEEIYYISESLDDIEKPFEGVVPRNRWRACLFRAIGWLVCYLTGYLLAKTLSSEGINIGRSFYGSWASAVFGAVFATALAALIIAAAYLCYSPAQSFKWMCVVALVIALPCMATQLALPMHVPSVQL